LCRHALLLRYYILDVHAPNPALGLTCAARSRDPLADVSGAILHCDTAGLAAFQKADAFLTHQSQVLEVQDYTASTRFRANYRFHMGYSFFVHSAAQPKDHFPACRPLNSQHPILLGEEILTVDACVPSNAFSCRTPCCSRRLHGCSFIAKQQRRGQVGI